MWYNMKKIFLLSTSFFTKLLLQNLNYVLNINFNTIVLLKENHTSTEKFPYNVELYNNIDECLIACDCIIILKTSSMPEKTINKVITEAKVANKKIFFLEYNNRELGYSLPSTLSTRFQEKHNIPPTIVHLSIGKAAQSYAVEILINKILHKYNVAFSQYFTDTTFNFLKQLSNQNALNKILCFQLHNDCTMNFIVLSIEVDIDRNEFETATSIIRDIYPDVLIVQTDFKNTDLDETKKEIFYKTGANVDIEIKSQYYPLKDSSIIHCDHVTNGNCTFVEDENLELILEKIIFRKLSYPKGISPL